MLKKSDPTAHRYARWVVADLAAAGQTQALEAVAGVGGALDDLGTVQNAVVLCLLALRDRRPGIGVPGAWTDAAVSWMTAGDGRPLSAAVEHVVQFEMGADEGRLFFDTARTSFATATLVAGDLPRRIRAVCQKRSTLVLAAAGSEMTPPDLVLAAGDLADLARDLSATIGYAYLSFEPDCRALTVNTNFPGSHQPDRLEPLWQVPLASTGRPAKHWRRS